MGILGTATFQPPDYNRELLGNSLEIKYEVYYLVLRNKEHKKFHVNENYRREKVKNFPTERNDHEETCILNNPDYITIEKMRFCFLVRSLLVKKEVDPASYHFNFSRVRSTKLSNFSEKKL